MSDIVCRPELYNLQTEAEKLKKHWEVRNELSINDGTRYSQI